ncbi:MAG: nitric oxide-sensing transcriptional repressor NsrR [Vibrio sp.]
MQLTSFTDYSIRTLIFLSTLPADELTNISTVSEKFNISKNHLIKVVHKLATLGYIDTVRGKNGGIKLAKSPSMINIGALVREIEPLQLLDCSEAACHITRACRLKSVLMQAKKAFLAELDTCHLGDLVEDNQSLHILLTRA